MESDNFRSISTLLIQRIMWLAVGCLLVLGSIHAWIEFRHEEHNFQKGMMRLGENSKRILSTALWDIDPAVVRQQVAWIGDLPEVAYVRVKANNSDEQFVAGRSIPLSAPGISMPLVGLNGQDVPLGVLEIWADSQYFVSVMLKSTLRIVLGYVLFTLLICAMVAWVMRRELRLPLAQIARFAAALKPNELATPLQLSRPRRQQADEIDLVIGGFQQLQEDLRRYIEHLDELVVDRTHQLENLVEEVKRMSMVDALTGCLNRRALDERLPAEQERSQRYGRPLSVVFIDIDHFKSINDQYGHGFGDAVLREVAARLQQHLRHQVDWIARYGGEEFIVVMPETAVHDALEVALRLAESVRSQPVVAHGESITVTASFGIAQLRDKEPVHTMLERADSMLYLAKREGRNCVRMAI